MPNKLTQFWQELKRRKVVQVIMVYAAAAYVIIELINNVSEPLRLPEWTPTLVIVILAIGFPLAAIFSWIFDVTPGGIEKTKPAYKVKEDEKKGGSKSWKMASYISFVVIFGLIILNIVTGASKKEMLEKSIAVLPFRNDSSDEENTHFINGTMESILDNLCKIKDLRVPGRTSVEQYRESSKDIPVIAQEMNVSYILEGSGQKLGNRILLTVQLLDGKKDQHLWSKQYDREIEKVEDLIDIQSEIARLVAAEIKAIITPYEEDLINKLPTTSMTAYEVYLKANEYRKEYIKTRDLSAYQTAVNLYRYSIEIDTTFAKAYIGLARAYYNRNYWPDFFTENFLDSCLVLANIALAIDDELDEAYYIKGLVNQQNGNIEEALNNYDRTLDINPNYYSAYASKGYLFSVVLSDNVKGLENYHQALKLVSADERPGLLGILGNRYADLGFIEKAKEYYQKEFVLDSNEMDYLRRLAWMQFNLENYEESLRLMNEIHMKDTSFLFNLHFFLYAPGNHMDEAFAATQKVIERFERTGVPIYFQSHRIGYIFYKMGRYEEAEAYFKQQLNYSEESIKLDRFYSQVKHAHYDMAATYAFLGEKEKAYEQLDEFNTMDFFGLMLISFVKNDPLFASIRNEERFQKILRDMEAKYQAEHERVRKWLEENDMF